MYSSILGVCSSVLGVCGSVLGVCSSILGVCSSILELASYPSAGRDISPPLVGEGDAGTKQVSGETKETE